MGSVSAEPKDRVAIYLAITVGIFVLATLVVIFVLALNGVGLPDVWNSLFGLVVAIMSALGGYLAGTATARKNGTS